MLYVSVRPTKYHHINGDHMREILFKARRYGNINSEWVEGYYFVSFVGNHKISRKIDGILHTDIIDPETLCQFTGACTADGKRIFEGDKVGFILHGEPISTHVVWWQDLTAFGFRGLYGTKVPEHLGTIVLKGNIHDEK